MDDAFVATFFWLVGLCVGSFVNVVVYRLIAGVPMGAPSRSFCPSCRATIAWRDNIPLLSWIVLRGRCRACGVGISIQYPLVEAATAMAFVLAYFLLFVIDARAGLGMAYLPHDLPLLLAWVILIGGLLACAAMDIVSYSIDVRITYAVVAAGVVATALWPRGPWLIRHAQTPLAAATVAAFVVGILWTLQRMRGAGAASGSHAERPAAPPATAQAESRLTRALGAAGAAACMLLAWAMIMQPLALEGVVAAKWLVGAAVALLLVIIVLAGGQHREADAEIVAAIEAERVSARGTAMLELLHLMPAVLAAAAVYWFLSASGDARSAWRAAMAWSAWRDFAPLAGAATALKGLVLAAAVGWGLRIVFTLIYGREALGAGDIYILAAAGAAAGWDVALLGLLASVVLALVGWVAGLALKASSMIPLGPWLGLGFVAALWMNRAADEMVGHYARGIRETWEVRPDLVLMMGSALVAAAIVAIVLSRLLRRLLEPGAAAPDDEGIGGASEPRSVSERGMSE